LEWFSPCISHGLLSLSAASKDLREESGHISTEGHSGFMQPQRSLHRRRLIVSRKLINNFTNRQVRIFRSSQRGIRLEL
jgi:hypothetical protein